MRRLKQQRIKTSGRVIIYEQVRTKHLQLLALMAPALLVYRTKSYDFHREFEVGLDTRHLSRLQTARLLLTHDFDSIELNEAAMVQAWPSLLLYTTCIRIRRVIRRRQVAVVMYAIENHDIALSVASHLKCGERLGRLLSRIIVGYLMRPVSKVAFGTTGAAAIYAGLLSKKQLNRIETEIFLDLPGPCGCGPLHKQKTLLFVGEFSERKGLTPMLELWDSVHELDSEIELQLIGKGPLEAHVRNWASSRPNVSLSVDPPRTEIHEALREAAAVVLLSQPTARWREQTALPVQEGLSHGCEIITTDQIGTAAWLAERGHIVVPPAIDPDQLARTVIEKIRHSRSPDVILTELPGSDTRVEADFWLQASPPKPI